MSRRWAEWVGSLLVTLVRGGRLSTDLEQREAWHRAAGGWERWQAELREVSAPVAGWLLNAIDPKPGQRVLELAAGPGETGFLVAQRLGPDGTLVSTDQSADMVGVARRRAKELGLTNVEFRVLDGQQIDLDERTFDAVLCRWGYMLMADPDAALRGTRRVLREGGRLALATWDTPDRNLWMSAPAMQLIARGAFPPPESGTPGPFSMAETAQIEQRLASAGFQQIETGKVEFDHVYPSFGQYWEMSLDLGAPLAVAMAQLDETTAVEVREAVRGVLAPFASSDGALRIPASAVVAAARA
jgi:ubiquinone/menaquinone biosynthesis C-methylase UbiE